MDACLHILLLDQRGERPLRSGDREVLQIVRTMIHVTGISGHSILKLTEEVGLSTRDCFPIARSIVESTINIIFIMARGKVAAQKADRHALQKSYRDLHRKSEGVGWRIELKSNLELASEDATRLEQLTKEFTTKKGAEKRDWTDESISERIAAAAGIFPEKSLVSLRTAFLGIYRHSSEVVHGTYFGAMFFWGLTTLGRRVKEKEDLEQVLADQQFSVLTSVIFALTALLECFCQYVGEPSLGDLASKEALSLQELPLIKEAMLSSSN